MAGTGEDLIMVSDLHLGPGPLETVESFYNDNAFARFLDHLMDRARAQDRRLRLVILGDLIDFLRAELLTNPGGEPLDESMALATLDRVIEGHPKVFEALGRFCGSGHSVDTVIGNHDADLVRPALQERLRAAMLGQHGTEDSDGVRAGTVSFHPWIYYVPGLLYAEHGHQYDELNCFSTVLEPFRDPDAKLLERPIGLFLFSEAERLNATLDPCPDHASDPRRYFALAARRHPGAAKAAIKRKVAVATATVREARAMSRQERDDRRARYREVVLPAYAGKTGLSPASLLAIDQLSAATKPPQRALATEALHRMRPSRPVGPLGRRSGYLESAAVGIHDVLSREGSGVPFYVFGHTHAAQHLPLAFGAGAPQYVNAGTWSSIVSPRAETLRTIYPTFVHVTPPSNGSPAVARLLAWNHANGAAETLRTQA